MTRLTRLALQWCAIDLGAGRGGSGATAVDLLLTALTDSDGATGTGFTFGLTGGAEASWSLLTGSLGRRCLGTELDHWPQTWQRCRAAINRLGDGHALPALSALDLAVHDLSARRAGLPLYRHLGAYADSVPIYGSGRATHAMSTAELIAGAESYREEGYAAVKLRIGAKPPLEDLARVMAVRDAVGDQVQLMVDANERLDLPGALWFGDRLADLGVGWLEEPLPAGDLDAHERLAARSRTPIAVGEHLQGLGRFAGYLTHGAAAVLQPDPPLAGGVTDWLKISALAEAAAVPLAPHFLPEVNVQLALATPNTAWVEHFPLIDEVLAETIEVREGRAYPPDRPGLGLVFDEDALAATRQVAETITE